MKDRERAFPKRALIWFNVVALAFFALAVVLGGSDAWFWSLAIMILGVPVWIIGNVVLGGFGLLRLIAKRERAGRPPS